MNQFQPLIEALFRERILRARELTPEQRLREALELADLHFSSNDPELRRRVAIIRKFEERDCYGPAQPRL